VALASYPRSGSNWLALMLGELLSGHEVDFETDPPPIPFVGGQAAAGSRLPGGGRLVKTHERWRREYTQGIYLVRHPVEVLVSYYAHHSAIAYSGVSFEQFAEAWAKGSLDGYGTWEQNVESWLDAPARLHLVHFEELVADTEGELRRMTEFLGLTAGDAAIAAAVANNSFERMRQKQERLHELQFGDPTLPPRAAGSAERLLDLLDVRLVARIAESSSDALARLGYTLERTPDPQPSPPLR
jgi:hypothetical protein